MKRDDYIRWCENCSKRSFDLKKGITCTYTNEIAAFDSECKLFDFDKKEFVKNVNNDVYNLCESSDDYIEKPKKIKWKKYSNKKSLPIELIIRNSGSWNYFIIMAVLDIFLLGYLYYDDVKDFVITADEKKAILRTVGILLFSLITVFPFVLRKVLDKSPKLIFNDKGIKIEDRELILWENAEFNLLIKYEGNNSSSQKVLIISPLFEKHVEFHINGLEYSPKKILHLIELYREK